MPSHAVTLPPPPDKLVLKLSCHFVSLLAKYLYRHILTNSQDSLAVLVDLGICHKKPLRPEERDLSLLLGICQSLYHSLPIRLYITVVS